MWSESICYSRGWTLPGRLGEAKVRDFSTRVCARECHGRLMFPLVRPFVVAMDRWVGIHCTFRYTVAASRLARRHTQGPCDKRIG